MGRLGPRPRVTPREIAMTLAWPVAWLAVTLVVGTTSGWYPYPFLDHREDGTGAVVVACLGVTVLFVALLGAAFWVDGRGHRPASPRPSATAAPPPG